MTCNEGKEEEEEEGRFAPSQSLNRAGRVLANARTSQQTPLSVLVATWWIRGFSCPRIFAGDVAIFGIQVNCVE